jgi:hypothetical protein
MKVLTLTTVAVFFFVVALAAAAEVSRETYVAQVEPICQANTKANEKILKNVKIDVRKGKLKPAATALEKASKALERTYAQLAAVPQPTTDEARLKKWLGYVKIEANLFTQTGRALRSGNKTKAQNLEARLNDNANQANAEVLSFEFHFCRFNPSKFT